MRMWRLCEPKLSMSESSPVLAEHLLQDILPHSARCGSKCLTLPSLVCLSLLMIFGWISGTLSRSNYVVMVEDRTISTALQDFLPLTGPSLRPLSATHFVQLGGNWKVAKSWLSPRRIPRNAIVVEAQGDSEAAVPDVWRPGPAELVSGQAKVQSNILRDSPWVFDDNLNTVLKELNIQKKEEERTNTELAETTDKNTLVLRRKTDEIRRKERARCVTELMYLKVCSSFKQLKVPLIPTLKGGGDVKFGVVDLKGLTTDVYTGDAFELVREHLFRVVGAQQPQVAFMGVTVVRIALFEAAQVYGMSSLLGYSLRNVDKRFQLEKLAGNFGSFGSKETGDKTNPFADDKAAASSLKEYISTFGPAEVERMLSVASVEARMAMELQVTALFGDVSMLKDKFVNAVGTVTSAEEATKKLAQAVEDNQLESMRLTSEDLTRLVLEAVAFGALTNDAEKQVDSVYDLTPTPRSRPPPGILPGGNAGGGGPPGPPALPR